MAGRGRLAAPWRVILPVVAFVLLGWCWAWASPAGASADENFHLTSIWCAWGDSDTCVTQSDGASVLVPLKVAQRPCFVQQREVSASCTRLLYSNDLVGSSFVNPSAGGYPPAFYAAMRVFVGPDVDRSVLIMRMANALIAGVLLLAVLMLAPPVIGRATAAVWAVGMIPTGLFFIPSVNPSSWSIIGVGLFWAFLFALLRSPGPRSTRGIAALAGCLVTALMAVLARSDSTWAIAVSIVAVVAFEGGFGRLGRKAWILVAAMIPLIAIALVFRVGRYLRELSFSWPSGNALTDQPNPVVKMLLEMPAFLAGILGMQQPWAMREESVNWGVDGWVMSAYSYGVGSLDVVNPSLSGVFCLLAAGGMLLLGMGWISRRKLAALAIALSGIVLQMITMRALGGFGNWQNDQGVAWVLQPRYFLPGLLVTMGLALVVQPFERRLLSPAQAVIVGALVSVAATVSLMSVIARYMHGQLHSWIQFDPAGGWWWPWGPHPVALVIAGALLSIVALGGLLSLGTGRRSLGATAG